jgi:hypothetical protein
MKKRRVLLIVTGAIAFCALAAVAWLRMIDASTVRSVANIELSGEATLLQKQSRSTRFGSEGVRVWVYDLSPSYSADLNARCEQLGYEVQPTQAVLKKHPFLGDYVSSAERSCVRARRHDALELAVLQDGRLVVALII